MTSQKISSFNVSTSLNDSDLFTFVVNGTNKNVKFSDFKLGLGVTGTLTAIGDPLAVQVLNEPTAQDYQIRAIESGAGILASVSPQNGITLDWNVLQDTVGEPIVVNLTSAQPSLCSLKAGTGISITKDGGALVFNNTVDPATGLSNRVVVTEAADLSGTIDSTKEYFIDGIVDMTGSGIEVEIPAGGINITGYNFDLSKIICSDSNYTLFKSPVGGSGDVLGRDYAIEVTGVNSKVYNITDATGFHAFEFSRINYNDCTSLGSITNYRQGLEVGTGRFGGMPQLELIGTWVGGYFIDTSIIRNLDDGAYSLFKAGAGFSMASRFRSNMNLDLPASASFVDFSASNFVNPSTLQLMGAIVTRDGLFDASDANITPNITESDLVSDWSGNNGMPNTFVGGSIGVTTELATANSGVGIGAFLDLAATLWTAADLQHFDNPTAGQLRHLGNTPREFKVIAEFVIASGSNDEVVLKVLKWDDSASSFVTVLNQARQINALVGGRDVAVFSININTTLDQNDYIKLQVANNTAAVDITAEVDSYFIVEAR